MPSLQQELTAVLASISLSILACGPANRSVIENRSIVIASVGQRIAQRPQRMQRSSSLTIADERQAVRLRARGQLRSASSSSRSSSSNGTIARQYSGQTSTQRLQSTHFSGS